MTTAPDDLRLRNMERIAVLRALHLGDLLCATPALRALKARFPDAEITLIGLPWAEDLVRRLPSIDRFAAFPGYPGIPEVEYDPKQTNAFLTEAREERYDLAIQMHGSGNQTNSFMADLGANITVGYRRLDDDRLTFSLPYVTDESEVLRWLRLVGLLGGDTAGWRIDYPTTSDEVARATTLVASVPQRPGPLVGLHAGASTPLRRWPPERFADLADALVERWNCRILLTGSDAERDLTTRICELARYPLLDVAGETDLGTFAAVIGHLDLLVANDTGASHVAAATGTPSVVIFGTTQPYQWAPLDRDRHLVVDARTFVSEETPPVEALAQLAIEPVLLACERHLESGISPATP